MEVWDRSHAAEVMALVDAALPGEGLTEDDVVANLFDDPDPTLVLGVPGSAVAAAVVRDDGSARRVHLQLVAVMPPAQRAGLARSLLDEVHRWAFGEHDAEAVVAGAGAPFYLWPGVDVHAVPALCLFEALGYRPMGAYLDLSYPSRYRAPVPAGIRVRRVLDEDDARSVVEFVGRHWPNWVAEARRAVDHASCHVAIDAEGAVVAFGCHSVNRLGVLGPIGTDPTRQHAGTGTALLGVIAADVMAAGLDEVVVSWIGPVRFYAKAAGATTKRAYLRLALPSPSRTRPPSGARP